MKIVKAKFAARLKQLSVLAFILLSTSGFRVFGDRWDIDASAPTLWVKFSDEDLLEPFELFQSGWQHESLKLLDDSSQRRALIQAAFAEFHNTGTSYVRLSFYPVDGLVDASTDEQDTVFSQEQAINRSINIKASSSGGPFTAGYASLEADSGIITGCSIVIDGETYGNAVAFYATLVHELGHCLGIEHNHTDTESIMSYNGSTYQMGLDDLMALTYLYPLDDDYANETPTFGMACAVREKK